MDWYRTSSTMDWPGEDESHEPNLRTCRAGFALVALGLTLLGFSAAVDTVLLLTGSDVLLWLMQRRAWTWLVDAPITWMTLLGAYLLWGGWASPLWRRRAGVLLLLNIIDAVQWGIDHNGLLGLRLGTVGHPWLRGQIGLAFNWIEFALFARLAAKLASHLGDESAIDADNKIRALSAAGGALWAIGFIHLTAWNHGWPLVPRGGPRVAGEAALIWLGKAALMFFTTLNIVALCILARRRCAQTLEETQHDERGLDLLKSRSESGDDDPWT